MYTSYVGNHDIASEFLRKSEKENKRFRDLLESNLVKPENRNLNLASFLIMPIQRIPRYKLLIEELLRNTSDTHPDYPNLMSGLDLVAKVAKHINSEMHASEKRHAILKLQNEFSDKPNWVSPSRWFVRQGPMVKQCRDSQKMYEFFLFNGKIMENKRALKHETKRTASSIISFLHFCLFCFFGLFAHLLSFGISGCAVRYYCCF
jgi:hypothetical protein